MKESALSNFPHHLKCCTDGSLLTHSAGEIKLVFQFLKHLHGTPEFPCPSYSGLHLLTERKHPG